MVSQRRDLCRSTPKGLALPGPGIAARASFRGGFFRPRGTFKKSTVTLRDSILITWLGSSQEKMARPPVEGK